MEAVEGSAAGEEDAAPLRFLETEDVAVAVGGSAHAMGLPTADSAAREAAADVAVGDAMAMKASRRPAEMAQAAALADEARKVLRRRL